ncbi:hypothetical protein [Methylomonas methanica]|uniref:hypothetical protein n=1 Tax=Methylomonas methanica TaxID=421 RepID=UPI00059B8F54|nr:hypothetical protein [Methylomonas methanica]
MLKRLAIVIWWLGAFSIAGGAIGGAIECATEIVDFYSEVNGYKQCIKRKELENSNYQEYLKQKKQESQLKSKEDEMLDDFRKWTEINKTKECIDPSFSDEWLFGVGAGLFIGIIFFSLSFIFGGSFWKPPKE